MHAIAEKRVTGAGTAWHCCLEFYSVSTSLPPEFRLAPGEAAILLEEEIFARMTVHDLPAAERLPVLRAAGAVVVVTDNRRHFLSALRYEMRVETPGEFLARVKPRRTS